MSTLRQMTKRPGTLRGVRVLACAGAFDRQATTVLLAP